MKDVVIICTRNRPDDLRKTLESLINQEGSSFLTVVVDASDPDEAGRVRSVVQKWPDRIRFVEYSMKPSLARQRNFGIDHLPPETERVHFLDDDVWLEPDYLRRIIRVFDEEPDTVGVGGRVLDDRNRGRENWLRKFARRLFLLETRKPGRILPSGGLLNAQIVDVSGRSDVEILGGCASYRRSVFDLVRFDGTLEGYSMDEDLDFSFRAGRMGRLIVEPDARLEHYSSDVERDSVRSWRRDLLVHRYWFVEKNVSHPLRKPAFWWQAAGSLLLCKLSSNPNSGEAALGVADAIKIILRRDHDLLSKPGQTESRSNGGN